jgi:uncharacterized protein (TIGR03118 family)
MRIRMWGMMASTAVLVGLSAIGMAAAAGYTQTNLVSDQLGVAPITDASLINPWGMAASATSPIWVSDNGTGVVTLYAVNPTTNVPTKQALTVSIPGAGSVTGQVFSPAASTGAFNGDNFLFVSEDGTISGWRSTLGTTAEVLQLSSTNNVYKGVALGTVAGHAYLYVANFRAGTIDVLKGDAVAPGLAGSFVDPNLPSGYAPFNIQNLGNQLYVTYALQDAAQHDDVAGAGHGFVNRFDLNGNLLGRLITAGPLNSPWGLAIAPANFGDFSNALLVGNFGDGTINAFSTANGTFLGTMLDAGAAQIVVRGLWGLLFGNGGSGGASNALYFTAGTGGEAHGLFGSFTPTPPILLGAALRRTHGSAGTFNLPLSLVAAPGINHNPATEPRQGPAHTVVFTFDKPVSAATATVTEGAATAGAPTFSGNDVIVALTGVTDQQYVTVALANVASSDGGTGGSGSARVGFLLGDVNQSRVVSVADLGLVNAQLSQSVTAANYLLDVNVSGTLSLADKGIANAGLTRALAAP